MTSELVRDTPAAGMLEDALGFHAAPSLTMNGGRPDLASVRGDARSCQRCPLYERATQTVFGEGGGSPRLMLLGEQPGDVEDRMGRPFVGPAGRLLHELLAEVGIDPAEVYLTNAVKHFKWRPSGGRRIHDTPTFAEVRACGHWLELELASVQPKLVVCLGATAAQALFGRAARVGVLRGRLHPLSPAWQALVTIHPSALLRAGERRHARRAELISDLTLAADLLRGRIPAQTSSTTKS